MPDIQNNRNPYFIRCKHECCSQHKNLLNIEIACTYVKLGRWRDNDLKSFPGSTILICECNVLLPQLRFHHIENVA